MEHATYLIGSFCFSLNCPDGFELPLNFRQFQTVNREAVDFSYTLFIADQLPVLRGNSVFRRSDIEIFRDGALESRYLFFSGSPEAYGVYREESSRSASCFLCRKYLPFSPVDSVFTSLFALERHLLRRRTLFLHCAALKVQEHALLLSGPSGIGKSTHAALWERYENAELINGDRILLQLSDNGWHTAGCPICGSSQICKNRELPVTSLVFLRQATTNSGMRLSAVRGVKELVSQLTVNSWDTDFVAAAWELAERFVLDVPTYEYSCNMEKNAAETLKKILEQNHGNI